MNLISLLYDIENCNNKIINTNDALYEETNNSNIYLPTPSFSLLNIFFLLKHNFNNPKTKQGIAINAIKAKLLFFYKIQ